MIQPDYSKYADGLIPAVVQDATTDKVLMVGFMNQDALERTESLGQVTFYSRTKKRLWTKGEESGNFLELRSMVLDCDQDTILVKANPKGPVCHTGADTCFNEVNVANKDTTASDSSKSVTNTEDISFLTHLGATIRDRFENRNGGSYTASLFNKGINAVAQKVGEEAIELVIEAKDDNKDKFLGEAADLLYHYLVLLQAKNHSLEDVITVLKSRHK